MPRCVDFRNKEAGFESGAHLLLCDVRELMHPPVVSSVQQERQEAETK